MSTTPEVSEVNKSFAAAVAAAVAAAMKPSLEYHTSKGFEWNESSVKELLHQYKSNINKKLSWDKIALHMNRVCHTTALDGEKCRLRVKLERNRFSRLTQARDRGEKDDEDIPAHLYDTFGYMSAPADSSDKQTYPDPEDSTGESAVTDADDPASTSRDFMWNEKSVKELLLQFTTSKMKKRISWERIAHHMNTFCSTTALTGEKCRLRVKTERARYLRLTRPDKRADGGLDIPNYLHDAFRTECTTKFLPILPAPKRPQPDDEDTPAVEPLGKRKKGSTAVNLVLDYLKKKNDDDERRHRERMAVLKEMLEILKK